MLIRETYETNCKPIRFLKTIRGTTNRTQKMDDHASTPVTTCNDLISISKLFNILNDDTTADYKPIISAMRNFTEAYGKDIDYGTEFVLFEDFEACSGQVLDKNPKVTPEKMIKQSKQKSAKIKLLDAFFGLNIAKTEMADLLSEIKKSLIYAKLVTNIHLDFDEQAKEINAIIEPDELVNVFKKIENVAKQSNGVMIRSSALLGAVANKLKISFSWVEITNMLGWSHSKLSNCIHIADLCTKYPKFLYATVNVTVLVQAHQKISKYLDNASYEEQFFWQNLDEYEECKSVSEQLGNMNLV